jgi:hypothetical protein
MKEVSVAAEATSPPLNAETGVASHAIMACEWSVICVCRLALGVNSMPGVAQTNAEQLAQSARWLQRSSRAFVRRCNRYQPVACDKL